MYSTYPSNNYEFAKGTSMASPTVAGIAALLFSQYPNLTAAQVKQIIMDSGTPINTKVVVGANNRVVEFKELSKSGKIVNAYNALLLASKISK
jgi:subtilisin family serine protease